MLYKKILPAVIFFITLIPAFADAASVYVIPVNGDIDRSLTVFIRRSIDAAEKAGADVIVIEINTFGGLVESALQIATLTGSAEAETIAYIPAIPESTGVSWSAGALISFSCDKIFMAPGTSMGAAAPVYQGAEGMQAAEEKTVSAVRGQMAALAEKNGYPKAAALAMVDADIELLEVEINGATQLVSSEDLDRIQQETEEAGGTFKKIRTVCASGKLLTLTANEMFKYGISSGMPDTREELYNMLGLSNPETSEAEITGPDRIITLITGSMLMTILIMLGLVAMYIEITSPGFGVPGTLAIIIFAVIFISNGMLGYVNSLEIILFIAGVVLLVVEIFLIPGFGAAGISGVLLITASLLLSQQGFVVPEFDWQTTMLKKNFSNVAIGVFGSIIIIAVIFKFFPRIGVFKRLILDTSQQQDDGYGLWEPDVGNKLIGKTGKALTVLRPAGKAVFDGETLVVESDGDFVEAGTDVIITGTDSNRVIVKEYIIGDLEK